MGNDKTYRIRYRNKWVRPFRQTGHYYFDLFDDPSDVEPVRRSKAVSSITLMAEDNDIPKDEFELVEV